MIVPLFFSSGKEETMLTQSMMLSRRSSKHSLWRAARFGYGRGGFASAELESLENRTLLSGTAPTAVDDGYATPEDTALIVPAAGVLMNDTDTESDPLTAALVAGATHGTLALNPDGSFTYTPNANYNGPDSFTYKANDGTGDSNVATVNITVSAANDLPVASNDAFATNEDTPLIVAAASGVLANDTDVDLDSLTAVLVGGPTHGALTLNPDGSFTYTPTANYNGPDSFTYKANDGTGDSNVATVNITVNAVNDLPIASNDTFTTNEDTPRVVAAPGVLVNDTDVESDPLTAVLVAGPAHGVLALNPDGSFTYTPDANFNGSDSFTYMANDGTGDGNVATVSITINAVNDLPVANNDTYATNEDTQLAPAAGTGVLANDTDIDGNTLTAVLVLGPTHGTFVLNANGSFTYTPAANYNGPDSFTYKANDGTGDSNVATVNITVTAVNDVPVATNDAYTTTEDTQLVIAAATGVLANDTDVESSPLTAVLVVAPAHGVLTLNADGSFTYAPAANYSGSDTFTYRANDGTASGNVATVNITLTAVNDAPVAVDDSYAATTSTALTVAAPGVLTNDTDADGNTLTATVVATPLNGTLTLNANGSFTYTPGAGFKGVDVFTYQVTDGVATSGTARVVITVSAPANHVPAATAFTVLRNPGSTALIDVLAHATDADDDPLGIGILVAPRNGRAFVDNNGTPLDFLDDSIEYIPNTDYFGADTLTYKVFDGNGGTRSAVVTIRVAQFGLSTSPFNPNKTDLVVLGTAGNDNIRLIQSGSKGVKVVINGVNEGVFTPTDRVIADGLAGNDTISAAGLKLDRRVVLYGGDGNDTLIGGSLPSKLHGGAGNDRLQGGSAGRDLLDGGSGHNVFA